MSGGWVAPIAETFDYSVLDAETATAVMRITDQIKHRKTCVGREIIGIGEDLAKAKEKLGHGPFGRWLSAEFHWDERTARRFMSVADAFKNNSDSVSDLMPTTLYALAAPSTPAAIREEIVRRREQGEDLGDHIVKSMVIEAKQKQEKAGRRLSAKVAHEARNSPAALKRAAKERQQAESRLRESEAAIDDAVAIIRARVGDMLPDLLDALERAGPGGVWRLPAKLRAAK